MRWKATTTTRVYTEAQRYLKDINVATEILQIECIQARFSKY